MIATAGKCDLERVRRPAGRAASKMECAWRTIRRPFLRGLEGAPAPPFTYIHDARKHSFTSGHTRTRVYSTRDPQRFCVIDSAKRRIAHCDK